MKKTNDRYKKALDILFEKTPIETIYDAFEERDFIEFHGSCGGDVLRYRVYNDGSVYCK